MSCHVVWVASDRIRLGLNWNQVCGATIETNPRTFQEGPDLAHGRGLRLLGVPGPVAQHRYVLHHVGLREGREPTVLAARLMVRLRMVYEGWGIKSTVGIGMDSAAGRACAHASCRARVAERASLTE